MRYVKNVMLLSLMLLHESLCFQSQANGPEPIHKFKEGNPDYTKCAETSIVQHLPLYKLFSFFPAWDKICTEIYSRRLVAFRLDGLLFCIM